MERDLHYTVDEKQKSVLITEEGYEAAEDVLQVRALHGRLAHMQPSLQRGMARTQMKRHPLRPCLKR